MGLFSTIAGAVAGPLVSGIFGKSKSAKQPKLDLGHMVKEANDNGFNPLTVLRNGGAATSMSGGQPARLSSASFIADAFSRGVEAWSGFDAQEAQAEQDQLRTQLLQQDLKNQQDYNKKLNSGNFGYQIPRIQTTTRQTANKPPALNNNPIAPDRDLEVDPLKNSPGVFEMDNKMTGGSAITLPGDGDPWGIDEVLTAVTVGAPQVIYKQAKKGLNELFSPEEKQKRKKARETFFPKRKAPKLTRPNMRQKPQSGWMDEKLGGFHY